MVKKARKITTHDIDKLNVGDCTVIAVHKRTKSKKEFPGEVVSFNKYLKKNAPEDLKNKKIVKAKISDNYDWVKYRQSK